jgi:hypothetical protein
MYTYLVRRFGVDVQVYAADDHNQAFAQAENIDGFIPVGVVYCDTDEADFILDVL